MNEEDDWNRRGGKGREKRRRVLEGEKRKGKRKGKEEEKSIV